MSLGLGHQSLGLGLGLEIAESWSWSWNLRVLVLVLDKQVLNPSLRSIMIILLLLNCEQERRSYRMAMVALASPR